MVCNNWWHISHLYLIFLQQNCHMNNPIQIMYKYILLSCFVWFSRTVVKLVYSYNYYKLYLKAYAYALLSISKMIHEVSRKCYENKFPTLRINILYTWVYTFLNGSLKVSKRSDSITLHDGTRGTAKQGFH